MLFCERCFVNEYLIQAVRENGTSDSCCPSCGSRNVYIVADSTIAPMIQHLATAYESVEGYHLKSNGSPIALLLQEDWDIFPDNIADNPELLNKYISHLLYYGVDRSDDHPDYDSDWIRTSDYLETIWHGATEGLLLNKIPVESSLGLNVLPYSIEAAFEDLSIDVKQDSAFFRARIHKDRYKTKALDKSELGAPDAENAKAGRANKEGTPVLYVANNLKTIIAETKPWLSAAIAVAEIRMNKTTHIIDFVDRDIIKNPFTDELLKWKVQLNALFERLSYELSLPVSPDFTERDYAITQELCNVIRKLGYDGVKYKSSVGPGFNIAFFDTTIGTVEKVSYYSIQDITYKIESLDANGPFYEPTPYSDIFEKE